MALDLDKLAEAASKAKDTQLPATRTRGSKPNPFTALIDQARKDGKDKTIPTAFSLKPGPVREVTAADGTVKTRERPSEAQQVENLLRSAAYAQGVGLRVDHTDKGDQRVISFRVQKKRSVRAAEMAQADKAAAPKK